MKISKIVCKQIINMNKKKLNADFPYIAMTRTKMIGVRAKYLHADFKIHIKANAWESIKRLNSFTLSVWSSLCLELGFRSVFVSCHFARRTCINGNNKKHPWNPKQNHIIHKGEKQVHPIYIYFVTLPICTCTHIFTTNITTMHVLCIQLFPLVHMFIKYI